MVWVSPKVDVPVFLCVAPDVAFARKPEYEINYVRRRFDAYVRFFDGFVKAVVRADGDVEVVFGVIREAVNGFVKG